MLELARHHIVRDRLSSRVRGAPVVVLEASSGFGKSTFASELSADRRAAEIVLTALDATPHGFLLLLRRALLKVDEYAAASSLAELSVPPSDLLEAMLAALSDAPELTLVIDDAHHLAQHAHLLVDLARRRPPGLRLVVTARVLPPAARPLLTVPGVEYVDASDLRFTAVDAATMLRDRFDLELDDDDVAHLMEVTGGWPAGLALAGFQLRTAGRLGPLVSPSALAEHFADVVLAAFPADLRHTVVQLAHLPSIDAHVVDAVSQVPGSLEQILAVGLPVARGHDGAVRVPGALADALQRRAPLDPAVADRVARALLARDRPHEAITVLRIAEDWDGVVRTLVEMSPAARRVLSADEVIASVEALPLAAYRDRPELFLELARAIGRTGVPGAQEDALERAESTGELSEAVRRAVDAERMTFEVYHRYARDREAQAVAMKELVAGCGPGEERTLARALLVQGQQHAWDGRRSEAEHLLRRSASLFVEVGEDYEASRALVQLGFIVHLHESLAVAEQTFARAVELAGTDGRIRATALTYLGEVKVWRGRPAEGVDDLEEAERLARAVRDDRAQAYAAWGLALQASVSGDTERTVARVAQAGRHLGAWMDSGVGATYVATMADLLDRAGATVQADRMLDEARRRRGEAPELTTLAEFGVAARRGDPVLAERMWSAIEADDGIEPFERVRCRILRAFAALRHDDPQTARRYREIVADGESLGEDGVPWHLEPAASRELARWWSEQSSGWRVRVLGELEVRRGDTVVPLPAGRLAELVVLLACSGRPLSVDAVLDALWDATDDPARARLRQVLYRVRRLAPGLVVREGSELRLGPDVAVDLDELRRRAARSAKHPLDRELAEHAVALVGPGLVSRVESPRIAVVTDTTREEVRSRLVPLLDRLERLDEDVPERQVEHLQRAHALSPDDPSRAERLASRLLDLGRADEADRVLAATHDALRELDLPVPRGLAELRRRARGSG